MLLSLGRPFSTTVFGFSVFIFLLLTLDQLIDTKKPAVLEEKGGRSPTAEVPKTRIQEEQAWSQHGFEMGAASRSQRQKQVPLDEYMSDMLKWNRPKDRDGKWPQYSWFEDRDYDPNRFEGFAQ
jgi:hypothetical protein